MWFGVKVLDCFLPGKQQVGGGGRMLVVLFREVLTVVLGDKARYVPYQNNHKDHQLQRQTFRFE